MYGKVFCSKCMDLSTYGNENKISITDTMKGLITELIYSYAYH